MFLPLRRSVHSSWIIAAVCGGITVGIFIVQWIDYQLFGSVSWLFIGAISLALAFWRRVTFMLVVGVFGGLMIGLWRGSQVSSEVAVYDHLVGSVALVRGEIQDDVDIDKQGNSVVRLKVMTVDNHPIKGTMWARVEDRPDLQRSDLVTVKGELVEGFGTFDATMPRADLVMAQRPQPGDVALTVRDWFADAVRRVIPEPEASLGIGYLVGQRRTLPPQLDEALRTASLTHIVVASGYNLTILVRLARRLLERKSKYLATLAAATLIISFIAVTGLSPSMSRAGLVAGLSLAAWYYGRKFHPLVLLPVAAAVTLLVNPSYGWNDLGWELSFASFGGVMIIAPLAQRYFFGNTQPGILRQILGETIAAQLATIPLIVYVFGTVSNVAVIANLLVLPFVPLAMLLVAIAGVGALMIPLSFASLVALPAGLLLSYMVWIIQQVAALPWAQTTLQIGPAAVLAYYVILGLGTAWLWRGTRFNLRDANIVE